MNTSKKAKNETYPTQTQDVRALLNAKPDTWPAEPIDPGKPLKWQTRRIMAPQPRGDRDYRYDGYDDDGCHYLEVVRDGQPTEIYVHVDRPPFLEGDRLWVRETWLRPNVTPRQILTGLLPIQYKADFTEDELAKIAEAYKWKPSIHMPREAARLFLEVREVRAERLRDMHEDDAGKEGILIDGRLCKMPCGDCTSDDCFDLRLPFIDLWDRINGKGAWESSPWVWVYEFMRREGEVL